MQPHIGFSFIAILVDAALANPIPEDYPDSDFLSDDLFAPDALDASSPMSFDLIAQPLAFSGLTSLSLDTDWLTDSSASPLEDAQIADFSDRPLETVDSSGAFLESSCEAGSEPFFKRDGEICTPEAAGEPYPSLKLPDLDDLENALGSERKKPRKLRQYLIPPTPGYTPDDDPLCPKPKRRLCCEGPRHGNMIWGWSVIDGCRDMGPWSCPAKYDVCCVRHLAYELLDGSIVAVGYTCYVLVENSSGINWEGLPGKAPPPE